MKENIPPVQQFMLPINTNPVDPRLGFTSASNAEPDFLCEGRHYAQKGKPELEKPEGYSEFGQVIHASLATRKPSGLSENALQIYERCLEIEERAILQFFGEEEKNQLLTVAHERYWVTIPGVERFKHSAEVDRVYRSKTKALVIDYKTLPGDVPGASSNAQLRDQVCLVHGNLMVANLGAVLIQPMVTMTPEICIYNAEQIKTSAREMFDRVRKSNTKDAPRTAGTIQCTHCRAKVSCLEYARFVAESTPALAEYAELPVAGWSVEQCVTFLERRKVAETWLKETLAAVRKRIAAGEIPGYEIGRGDREFEVIDMPELARRLETFGIPNEEFLTLCTPNKAGLTRKVRLLADLKGKGLTAKVDELLSGIVSDGRKSGSIERIKE